MEATAVVFKGPGEVENMTVEIPAPAEGEVVMRTEYSLISSGTERWIWRGEFHPPGQPPPSFPLVPGYQRVGIIEQVGPGVTDLQPGMRATATISRLEGLTAFSGSHCQYGVTRADQCLPVPPGVSPVAVSGLVLTQVGYNGGSRPVVREGDLAVVLGDGLVGQWLAQRLADRGASVVMAGKHELRLDRAETYAHARGVLVTEEDLPTVVRELKPDGADIVADTLAVPEAMDLAISLLRRDGQLVLNGYYREGYHLLSIQALHEKEITVYGPAGWTRPRLEATLELVREGRMEVEGLITHRVPWAKAAEAYKRLVWDKAEEFLGIVIEWEA
ncbi:MAG: zinc-binding alcohol dehydrogenase [Armatimonadetes bacterium]|nr:zinc-binding alcohol dehydrogenase [Armatimonadota bacterium]